MAGFLAGEFFLRNRPNGGTVVLRRTIFISILLYLVAIALKARLSEGAGWGFDSTEARKVIGETIPWFGAIFAGVYVALYTRFASQWSYLASLYNQLMQAQVETAKTKEDRELCLAFWQAAFIEDAEELHLARKPMFATIIADLLDDPAVRKAYVGFSPGGEARLRLLEEQLEVVLERTRQLYPTPTPVPNSPAPPASEAAT